VALALSVLDLSPIASGSTSSDALRNTIDLAQLADRLGYTRYWLAEHHNMPAIASSAPEIMIGQVARATSRIRVGSGGIMLPNHAPLKVAEWFRTLEALFPGRIDLGLGRAPGTDAATARALRGMRADLRAENFPAQLDELFRFCGGGFPASHPFASVTAMPQDVPLPPVWLLGSSDYSAQLAGQLGLPFAFASHFSPLDPALAVGAYRDSFRPSVHMEQPRAIVAASVVCAETDAEAAFQAGSFHLYWLRFRRGEPGPLPSPEEAAAYGIAENALALATAGRSSLMVGAADSVKAAILNLADRTGTDEVMITSWIYSHEKRRRSYELLAEAFGIG
jgi:luciferase family oxidoreductase group 1